MEYELLLVDMVEYVDEFDGMNGVRTSEGNGADVLENGVGVIAVVLG